METKERAEEIKAKQGRNKLKIDYLKSVVGFHFSRQKTRPTEKGLKLLEDGQKKTFNQLMRDLNTVRKPADKACVLLMATQKANSRIEIARVCKAIGKQKQQKEIIDAIDTAYPDSKVARIVTSEASQEFFSNMVKTSNELAKKAKQLRMIVKKLM